MKNKYSRRNLLKKIFRLRKEELDLLFEKYKRKNYSQRNYVPVAENSTTNRIGAITSGLAP